MIKPLVIAYPFLHESDACGRIEQQFFSKLDPARFQPTIVCSEQRGVDQNRGEFNKVVIPESKLIFNTFRVFNRLNLADYVFLPDYQKSAWADKVIAQISDDVKKGKYDYVHTINMPCSSHLIGLELKKKYGIPWVAQFYDPWYNNPYRQQRHSIVTRKDAIFEKEVALNADLVLHANQLMIDDWIKEYGEIVKNKIALLPYIVEEQQKNEFSKKNECFTISHIGNLQRGRTSEVFIKAVAGLVAQFPEAKKRIRVNYVGTATDNELNLIYKNHLENIFNIVGRITAEECNKFFNEADAFLLIDTEHEHNVYFPSKLLNYLYYGKPIVGLCQKESVSRQELIASGNYVFDYEDKEGISSFLAGVIKGEIQIDTNDKNYWKKHSKEAVISKYELLTSKYLIK